MHYVTRYRHVQYIWFWIGTNFFVPPRSLSLMGLIIPFLTVSINDPPYNGFRQVEIARKVAMKHYSSRTANINCTAADFVSQHPWPPPLQILPLLCQLQY